MAYMSEILGVDIDGEGRNSESDSEEEQEVDEGGPSADGQPSNQPGLFTSPTDPRP